MEGRRKQLHFTIAGRPGSSFRPAGSLFGFSSEHASGSLRIRPIMTRSCRPDCHRHGNFLVVR
jgi:hypothetical protein